MTPTIFDQWCFAALLGAYTVLALTVAFYALAWTAKRLDKLIWDDDLRLPR
jgi:hypothetical protein